MAEWTIQGRKDGQSVTPDWRLVDEGAIDGVVTRAVAHVPTADGHLTEILRTEWLPQGQRGIEQVFQKTYLPGAVSAWHAHAFTTDRLFCVFGRMLVVLYDARKGSPTEGQLAKYRIGTESPKLIVVPPGVWHGVKNTGPNPAIVINAVDNAYRYTDPDHWREPPDSPQIPFKF